MKYPLRAFVYLLLTAAPQTQSADADFITDGYFQSLSYSGSKTLTTLYGQFGTGTGSTLTLANWSTTGYSFVYAPGTADAGTTTGANSGAANEAPGQYNTSSGYGSTYLWGANNGGLSTFTAYPGPANENFLASDGAYEVAAVSQIINGLTVGQLYAVKFYWAAAQQQNFSGATTENWTATLGSQSFTTSTYNLASKSFSGWMPQTFVYTATSTSETLSFLAGGTPSGLPPFVLLGGVSMDAVPEPSGWMLFTGLGFAGMLIEVIRRRRRVACQPGEFI